ncbi:MAG: MFS transporter [Pseudomonadota bacterium]
MFDKDNKDLKNDKDNKDLEDDKDNKDLEDDKDNKDLKNDKDKIKYTDADYIDIVSGYKKVVQSKEVTTSSIWDIVFSISFWPYMVVQFLSALNQNIIRSTVIMYILFCMKNNDIMILLVNALFILPTLIFGLLAGRIGLYYDYTRIAQVVKFTEIFTVVLNLYAILTNNIFLMYCSVFLTGVDVVFFGTVKLVIPTCLLHSRYYNLSNSFIEASTYIGILLGTILGGFAFLDDYIGFSIRMFMLVIAVLGFLISLLIPKSNNNIVKNNSSFALYNDSDLDIFKYVYNKSVLFYTALATAWFWLLGSIVMSIMPILAKSVMNSSVFITNIFLSVFSIGIVIGSYIVYKLLDGEITLKYCILALLGVSLCSLDLYYIVPLVINKIDIDIIEFLSIPLNIRILFDLLLLCICLSIFVIPVFSLLQLAVVDHQNSNRIIGVVNLYHTVMMMFSTILLSFLFFIGLSISKILLVVACMNIFVIVIAYYAIPNSRLIPLSIWRVVLRFLLSRIYNINVKNIENYKEVGEKLIIIANHISYFDAFFIAAFIPVDRVCFAIDAGICKKYLWWPFNNIINVFPVNILDPFSIKNMIAKVNRGEVLVIFPEGRVTKTGGVMKIQEGAGVIAYRSGANILPIFLDAGKSYGKIFPSMTMQIFPIIKFITDDEITAKEKRKRIANQIYDHMLYMRYQTNNKPCSLYQQLIRSGKLHGMNRVVFFNDINCFNGITYNDIILKSIVMSRVLKNEHVLGIMLPTTMATVVLLYSMQLRNITSVMLNFTLGIDVLLSSVQNLKLKTIYTSQQFINQANLEHMVEALKRKNINVIFLEDVRDNQISIVDKIAGYVYSFFPSYYYNYVSPNVDIDDISMILFTSGSESQPKSVCLSHKNIYSNLSQALSTVNINHQDVIMHTLPMFHSFGMFGMFIAVRTSAKAFLYPSPLDYKIIPQIFYEISGTVMFSTNKFLESYEKHAHDYDFFSARYIFAGAEKLQEEVSKRWFDKFGQRILQGYGATEASPVISLNTHLLCRKNTVGKVIPGISIKTCKVEGYDDNIQNPTHAVGKNTIDIAKDSHGVDNFKGVNHKKDADNVKANLIENEQSNLNNSQQDGSLTNGVHDSVKNDVVEIGYNKYMSNKGELYIKGDNVMKGYLDYNNLQVKCDNKDSAILWSQYFSKIRRNWKYSGIDMHGWYATGDIVSIDNDGYISIIGRIKRFIKIAGEMIALDAIEVFYSKYVKECAVIEYYLNDRECFILFVTDKSFDMDKVLSLIESNNVSMLYKPYEIVFIEEIPLFVNGKVNYNILKKYCGDLKKDDI